MLYIPDIRVAASLYLFLGLIDRAAETVIDLGMDALLVLIPDQVRYIVDGGFKKMACLPEIPAHLTGLLPSQKTEADLVV